MGELQTDTTIRPPVQHRVKRCTGEFKTKRYSPTKIVHPLTAAQQLGLDLKMHGDIAFNANAAALAYTFGFEHPRIYRRIYGISPEEGKRLHDLIHGL